MSNKIQICFCVFGINIIYIVCRFVKLVFIGTICLQDYNMLPPEPLPRVFPKDENPSLVKRNKRMLGQLLGTLEVLKFYLLFFGCSVGFL